MMKRLAIATIAASIMAVGISLPRANAAEGLTPAGPLNPQGVLKPEPFRDVPPDHWAYTAVEFLRSQGLVEGYPDRTYKGNDKLTRYEFAQTIWRMVLGLQKQFGTKEVVGTGISEDELNRRLAQLRNQIVPESRINQLIQEQISKIQPGVTRAEIDQLRRLIDEFRPELARLGADVDALKKQLAALEGRVNAIEEYLQRIPQWFGTATVLPKGAAKSDQTFDPISGTFRPTLDHDGRPITDDTNVLSPVLGYYDADLGMRVQRGDVRVGAVLNIGNYVSSYDAPIFHDYVSEGPDRVTPYKLFLNVPFRFLGTTEITLGRLGTQGTPYTFWAIDPDTYTFVPREDSGEVVMTAAIQSSMRWGDLGLRAVAGTHPLDGRLLPLNNYPEFFGVVNNTAVFANTNVFGDSGRIGAAPISQIGNLVFARLAYGEPVVSPFRAWELPVGTIEQLHLKSTSPMVGEVIPSAPGTPAPEAAATGPAAAGFTVGPFQNTVVGLNYMLAGNNGVSAALEDTRAQVVGADLRTRLGLGAFGIRLQAESAWARSETGGFARPRAVDDSAIDARGFLTVGLGSIGDLELGGGWRRITLDYVVPGYWGVIGSWKNPRGIEGPLAEVNLPLKWHLASFLSNIVLKGSAEFYEGAHDITTLGATPGTDPTETNLRIDRYLAGVQFGLTSRDTVDLGVEQVLRNYVAARTTDAPLALPTMGVAGSPLVGTRIKNTETYINLGLGHSFTPDIAAKLLYQLVDFEKFAVDNSNQPANYRGYVATAQVGVRF